jgi:hypothetical protein
VYSRLKRSYEIVRRDAANAEKIFLDTDVSSLLAVFKVSFEYRGGSELEGAIA